MKVMQIRKSFFSSEALIERALPEIGDLEVAVGDTVEPFTKLGMTKVSYAVMPLPLGLHFARGKDADSFFYEGEELGGIGLHKVKAPFNGQIVQAEHSLVFKQEPRDFWLLAGVWGEVVNILDKQSVLLKTRMQCFNFAACTNASFAGELIVFPNPSELLEVQYLEKFAKDVHGKIIYFGDFVSTELLTRAGDLGAGAVLAGSARRETFVQAKKISLFLGTFGGFGHIPTPKFIFDALKDVSSRYVFVQGEKNLLKIPVPIDLPAVGNSGEAEAILRELTVGDSVLVLQKPHFGCAGKVKSVQGDKVCVILDRTSTEVEVGLPNLVALT